MNSDVRKTDKDSRKVLSIVLWLVQILLFLMFGMAGVMKSIMPITDLGKNLPWATEVPALLVRFIGIAEVAGALGILVPTLTRIWVILTPLAGIGLAIIMVLAMGFHFLRGEILSIAVNIIFGGLAVFVVWGRYRQTPIVPRS